MYKSVSSKTFISIAKYKNLKRLLEKMMIAIYRLLYMANLNFSNTVQATAPISSDLRGSTVLSTVVQYMNGMNTKVGLYLP